tara:strand:+ start:1186 stop:1944 length:759 start_codon:yes stop_codon:yes gene_type:complete
MSKKRFASFVEDLSDEQIDNLAGVGASLRDFGTALEADFLVRRGKLLNAEQRKENGGEPNATANPVIDVEVPGVMCIMLQPCDENNKARGNGYANDVGLSDKVKTGNVPPTLVAEILLDKLIGMLNGKVADKALLEVKEALKTGMTVTDGKFTFDKKAAPPLKHAVEVAEWMAELKTSFIGTTNGATHTSMEVIPIPLDPHSTQPMTNTDTAEPPSLAGSSPNTELSVGIVSPDVVASGDSSFIDHFAGGVV